MRDLFDFAYFPNLDDNIQKLADLAQDEDWEYKNTRSDEKKPILKSYFNDTLRRCLEERKVIELNGKACFNTGLVTNNQEEIFAFFVPNNRNNPQEQWFFKGFFKDSDSDIRRDFDKLPEVASYFENPADLVYDVRIGLPKIDYDRLFPQVQQHLPTPYNSMVGYELEPFLEERWIKSAIKRVKRNYKTAVPQFFWDKKATQGELQLLLPLCVKNPSKANAALVVVRKDNSYLGKAILPLHRAYEKARLLARPDTEWLQP